MRPRSRSKLLGWAVALIPVLAGVWWLASAFGDEGLRQEVAVARGDLVLSAEVTGILRAADSSFLGPPQVGRSWQFRIAHMAPEGAEIEAGVPVLFFDSSELEQNLLTLQAEAATAEKEIEAAQKEIEAQQRDQRLRLNMEKATLRRARMKIDRPEDLQSGQELALARLDLESAEMTVVYVESTKELSGFLNEARLAGLRDQRDRALRRVRELQNQIQEMTRVAPRKGTVIYVTDWAGNKKQVGDRCWKGDNVIELPDLSVMRGEGEVDEADAGRLAEGQRVTLRLDAHPDLEFTGQVASISNTFQPSTSAPIKVARLWIELDTTDAQRMRPGMRFRGRVETESATGVLLLPLDAVEATAQGPVVYREGLLGREPVRVELGRRSATQVEVLGGLREGDVVERITVRGSEGT